jgi:predicted RNA-binding Zn ribbon-like protein
MSGTARTLAGLDLLGGAVALDFANSVNSRLAPAHDYLSTYEDVVAWARRAGLPPVGAHAQAVDIRVSARTLQRALRLREAIYRTFSAIAAGTAPPPPDVRRVLRAYGAAVSRGSLERDGDRSTMRWSHSTELPARLLDPIAYSAGALLLASDRYRIKECPGCGWLFLDQSRNGTRRWCDMQVCGSRDKMRRYYRNRRG